MYTREQYEQDRRKAIEDGVNPRLIMSYQECIAWDEWQRTKDEWEDDAWDDEGELSEEDVRQMREAYEELEREKAAAESEEIAELAEFAEECAMSELAAFGSCEPWFFGEPEMNVFGADYSKSVWSDERYLVGEEWDAWDAATDDIPEPFFELDWSM